ncbi:MAG TPA: hypothetical protein DEA27_04870, partial [Candidatus Moranbacteria bacterium]|nr:hypothetical protein [Candidatus Moranbacteria bacterium]
SPKAALFFFLERFFRGSNVLEFSFSVFETRISGKSAESVSILMFLSLRSVDNFVYIEKMW